MTTTDILLVEDNPGDVRLTMEAFDETPVESQVHVVTRGDDALSFLYNRDGYEDSPRPDVILLDLNLPRTSGMTVLETLKTDPSLQSIPTIILTSSTAEEDITQAYHNHANAYLTKPVNPDQYIEALHSFEQFWAETAQLPTEERS